MNQSNLETQIADFWEWFTLNKTLLENVIESDRHPQVEQVIEQLNQYVLALGKLKWEIGNPSEGKYTFTLSPNSNRELLQVTRQTMSEAPVFNGWHFHYAIPPKGEFIIQLYDNQMDLQEVDANEWNVILNTIPDGRFELIIQANNTGHLDEDTEIVAADILLNSILGEELKITTLAGVEIVQQLEEKDQEKQFSIHELLPILS